jgi:hypothetical protein
VQKSRSAEEQKCRRCWPPRPRGCVRLARKNGGLPVTSICICRSNVTKGQNVTIYLKNQPKNTSGPIVTQEWNVTGETGFITGRLNVTLWHLAPIFGSQCSLGWTYNPSTFRSNCRKYEMSQWTKQPVDVPLGSKCSVVVPLVDVLSMHHILELWRSSWSLGAHPGALNAHL